MATLEEVETGLATACIQSNTLKGVLTSSVFDDVSKVGFRIRAKNLHADTQLLKQACIDHGLTDEHLMFLGFILTNLAQCHLDIPGLPDLSEFVAKTDHNV